MKILTGLFRDKDKRLKLIFALGIAGIALIVIPDLMPFGNKSSRKETAPGSSLEQTEEYRRTLEERLAGIISGISGAGETRVMISFSAAEEYVYAEKSDIDRRTQSGDETLRRQGEPVVNGQQGALLKTVLVPKISGAAVVCEGAADPVTRERILDAAAAVLGIPAVRISVQPLDSTAGKIRPE